MANTQLTSDVPLPYFSWAEYDFENSVKKKVCSPISSSLLLPLLLASTMSNDQKHQMTSHGNIRSYFSNFHFLLFFFSFLSLYCSPLPSLSDCNSAHRSIHIQLWTSASASVDGDHDEAWYQNSFLWQLHAQQGISLSLFIFHPYPFLSILPSPPLPSPSPFQPRLPSPHTHVGHTPRIYFKVWGKLQRA